MASYFFAVGRGERVRCWMWELPCPALFICCSSMPSSTNHYPLLTVGFILLCRSFFQRPKAEHPGCCPTAHCTVDLHRAALTREQAVGHFTLHGFFFFSHGFPWVHGRKGILHNFGFASESRISPMSSSLHEMLSYAKLLEKKMMGAGLLMTQLRTRSAARLDKA